MTTFLKFPDEAAFNAACAELGVTPASEMRIGDCSLSVIGAIEGTDGWHVNALGTLPDGWGAMAVEVSSPVRVFG